MAGVSPGVLCDLPVGFYDELTRLKANSVSPLSCCRNTIYFVLLPKIQTPLSPHVMCSIFMSDFNRIFSTDFH